MALDQLKEDLLLFLDEHQVDDEAVQSAIEVDFVGKMEGAEFDFEGVGNQWEQIIKSIYRVLKEDNTEDIISRIEQNAISLKKIVTVLGFAMEKYLDKRGESLIISLTAARMYLLLICFQSSHVFGVFYNSMVKRAFSVLMEAYKQKTLYDIISTSKTKKTKKNIINATKNTINETTQNNAECDTVETFSPELLRTLSIGLFNALENIFVFLQYDIVKDFIEDVVKLIKVVVRFDYSSNTKISEGETIEEFRKLNLFSSRCFALARIIMSERFYKEDYILSNFCLPRLIFKPFEGENFLRGPLPQNMVTLANVMVEFIVYEYADKVESRQIFVKRIAQNVVHYCLAERIDYRHASINIALSLLENLPQYLIHEFCYFAVNYSYLNSQRSKLVSVDLVCAILDKFDIKSFPSGIKLNNEVDHEFYGIYKALELQNECFMEMCPGAKDYQNKIIQFKGDPNFNSYDTMIRVLVRFTMDKVSAVRGRALNGLLSYINTAEGYKLLSEYAKHFLIDKTNKVVKILSEVNVYDEKNNFKETQVSTQRTETPIPTQALEGAQKEAEFITNISAAPFIDLIVQRCNDKSVVTRKFTIPLLETMLKFESNQKYQQLLLEKLQDFCRDPSVQVRKLAAESMTRVVKDEVIFKKIWLDSLLPMVNDRDESVEKSCRKMFFEKIVCPIVANDGNDSLSWNLVIEIAKSLSFKRAFRRCFRFIAQDPENKPLLRKLVNVLYGAIKVDAISKSAWMLLDYLSDCIDVDVVPAMHAWFSSDESRCVEPEVRIVTDPSELLSVLNVIFKRKDSIQEPYYEQLRDNIGIKIINLSLPSQIVSDVILTFVSLMNPEDSNDNMKNVKEFFKQVIQKCYNELLVCPENEKMWPLERRKKQIGLRLLTIGQSAMHSPEAITEDLVLLLFHILSVESPAIDKEMDNATRSRPPTRTGTGCTQNLVITKIQQLPVRDITAEITAAAVIALGKIIISNESIGREYLTKLIQVMGTSSHASVRNNIIYTLADCYLRYTSKMDTLQKAFLHGLRDKIDYVRYHTLLLTTELIRSQYMKLTALVVARLLPLLLDKEESVRDALERETLAVIEDQFPTVYIDNFVTVMFLLNRVPHGAYNDIKSLEMPVNPICYMTHDLSGELRRPMRISLYKFMLKKFDDQQKFMLINAISRTIFGSIVEGKIDFEMPEVKQLLLDGFQVIQLPEAKLQLDEGLREEDDEADLPPEELQKMAKKTIRVTFCTAFVQVIMPQFMVISRFLAQKKSPLQKSFRNCLAVIAESYPEELDLLFKDNAQLKLEIIAELKARKRDARKSRMERNQQLVRNIANVINEVNKENTEPQIEQTQEDRPVTIKTEATAEEIEKTIERTAVELQEVSVHSKDNGEDNQHVENEQDDSVFENDKHSEDNQHVENEQHEDVPENDNDAEEKTMVPESSKLNNTMIMKTPQEPPNKRRKSEISVDALQNMEKNQTLTLPMNSNLYAQIPILSPRVIGIKMKRIHSTPKRSTETNEHEFTFGGDISMIPPPERSRIDFDES